jgi:hypothetical protein
VLRETRLQTQKGSRHHNASTFCANVQNTTEHPSTAPQCALNDEEEMTVPLVDENWGREQRWVTHSVEDCVLAALRGPRANGGERGGNRGGSLLQCV